MSDDDLDFVTVAELDDPIRAQMLVSLLEDHDIIVQSPGMNHRAMLGYQVLVYLKVPRASEAEARELVTAFYGAGQDAGSDDEQLGPYRREPQDEEAHEAPATRRKRRVVAFCSLALSFGTGHFYVGEPGGAWILLGAQIAALSLGCGGPAAWKGAVLGVPLLVAYDLFDGIAAVGRLERATPRPFAAQVLAALIVAVIAIGGGALLGPAYFDWAQHADADAAAARDAAQ